MADGHRRNAEGMQILLWKAVNEPHFADLLLADPFVAARYAEVEITDAEAAVLMAVERDQLRTMLAALPDPDEAPPPADDPVVNTGGILSDEPPRARSAGIAPDEPPPVATHGISPDEPPLVSKGHRADIPSRLWRWLRGK